MKQNSGKQLKIGDKLTLILDYEIPTNFTCVAGRKTTDKQEKFNCELIDEAEGLGKVKMFYVKVISENNPFVRKEFWAPARQIAERIVEETA